MFNVCTPGYPYAHTGYSTHQARLQNHTTAPFISVVTMCL